MNKDITINNKSIYWKSWRNAGILYINDIINKTNGHFLTHNELQMIYRIGFRSTTLKLKYKNLNARTFIST